MSAEIEPNKQAPLSPTEFINKINGNLNILDKDNKGSQLEVLFRITDVLTLSDWLTQEQFDGERANMLESLAGSYNKVFNNKIDATSARLDLARGLHFFLFDQYIKTGDAFKINNALNEASRNELWFYPKAMRELSEVISRHSYR